MSFVLSTDPLPTLNAAQAAGFLQTTEERFLRQVRRLERDHGFPRHLPGIVRRWSRAQVLAWIDRGGGIEGTGLAQTPAEVVDLVTAAERQLAKRYGGRA